MSLGVVVKGSSGVVLASDTRVTLTAHRKDHPPVTVGFDNASKLLTLGSPHNHFAAVTYGEALVGTRTPSSLMAEFGHTIGDDRVEVVEYARQMSGFFATRWQEEGMSAGRPSTRGVNFIVSGYDRGQANGKVFVFNVPNDPNPTPRNPDSFGMTWGGQINIVSRVIQGYDPALLSVLKDDIGLPDSDISKFQEAAGKRLPFTIPYEVLPLQDCINLAVFVVRTTMAAQELAVVERGVGGMIEVATITPQDGFRWIQQRKLHGEAP